MVHIYRILDIFISCFITFVIEILSTICCSDHVDNAIISFIPELSLAHPDLIHNGLPQLLTDVGTPIHQTPVTQYHGGQSLVPCELSKVVLQVHLHPHQRRLEFNCLRERQDRGVYHSSTFHEEGGCFGD